MTNRTCSIDACDKPARRRGWCGMHHQRFLRYGDVHATKYVRSGVRDQLDRYVDRSAGPDGCWPWVGARHAIGYGRVSVGGSREYAHRVAFHLEHGRWPEPACLHHCDNPPCCNPKHLHEGTQLDNLRERDERGRNARGETHARAKVTEDDVREIRRLVAQGALRTVVAEKFGLTPRTVSGIAARETWRHVA